jgi:hypothetical protein
MSQAGRFATAASLGAVTTLTGNSGGAVPPTGGNINVVGGNNINIVGNPGTSTLTASISGTTNHAIQLGNASGSLTSLGVATNGQIPIGSTGADPVLATITAGSGVTVTNGAGTITIAATGSGGTVTSISAGTGITLTPNPITTTGSVALTIPVVVSSGGTGATTLTSNGVLLGNGTSPITATTAGTTGQVLTGVTGSAPTFQAPAASSITITGDSGGGLTGNSFTFTGGTTGLTFAGAGSTETLGGTLVVANGGTGRATLTNHGLLVGAGTAAITQLANATNGQLPIGSTGADPVLATITAGTGITVTNGAGSITIAANGAGFPYTDESTSFSAVSNNGYFVTGTATATMPASPSQGDRITFILDTTNVLTVTANTGQVLRIGSTVSASAGTAASNARGDSVTFIYRSSDTAWIAMSVVGTWTVN